jgi:hypothetical protein
MRFRQNKKQNKKEQNQKKTKKRQKTSFFCTRDLKHPAEGDLLEAQPPAIPINECQQPPYVGVEKIEKQQPSKLISWWSSRNNKQSSSNPAIRNVSNP